MRPHLVDVVADVGVEHQADVPVARVAGRPVRLAVGGDVASRGRRGFITSRLVRMLAPMRPAIVNVSGLPPAVIQIGGAGCTGGGNMRTEIVASVAARGRHGLAAPQGAHRLDARGHQLAAIGEVLRREREVVGVPAGRERQPDAPVREVVDDRPVLGTADRVVQRAARRCRRGCRCAR